MPSPHSPVGRARSVMTAAHNFGSHEQMFGAEQQVRRPGAKRLRSATAPMSGYRQGVDAR